MGKNWGSVGSIDRILVCGMERRPLVDRRCAGTRLSRGTGHEPDMLGLLQGVSVRGRPYTLHAVTAGVRARAGRRRRCCLTTAVVATCACPLRCCLLPVIWTGWVSCRRSATQRTLSPCSQGKAVSRAAAPTAAVQQNLVRSYVYRYYSADMCKAGLRTLRAA